MRDSREQKVNFSDIEHGDAREVMKTYGLNERQMERGIRNHLRGASKKEMQHYYHKFYDRKK